MNSKTWELILKTVPVVLASGTFLFGIVRYVRAADERRVQDAQRAYWNEQLEAYKAAAKTTAAIAIRTPADAGTAILDFRRMYWGDLALVEDAQVEGAMVKFDERLTECEKSPNAMCDGLDQLALEVAHRCRDSLKSTWKPVEIEKLPPRRK